MGTSVAFAALLLLLLETTAHGIRLDRQLHEAINNKEMGDPKSDDASIAHSVNKHCDLDAHCPSGKVKKPLTHAEPGAAKQMQSSKKNNGHTTVDADATTPQGGRHEAEVTSHVSGQEAAEATPSVPWQGQTYPDMMDIAGMDYSPATRRSPIHN